MARLWCIPVIVFSKIFYAWAKEENSDAYIACAHKMFKDLFLSGKNYGPRLLISVQNLPGFWGKQR